MPRVDNKKFYISAIEKYGFTAKGVNWASKKNQEIRFDVLLDMLPGDISSASVADAGCGFGDLFIYMYKKKKMAAEYIGIDSLSSMYEIAQSKTGCTILQADICRDKIPHVDYYLCSGAMNVLNEFETHLFIRNCFEASTCGFIFNILHGDRESETYNYVTTSAIEKIASDLHVDKVIYKTGYLKNDITVAFLKENN
jgi:SAM-dependent methyltransferase